jgi:hypothetical protein
MSCPHLKEVVMLYCSACPIKKMIPLDRLVSASPCLTPGYDQCRMFVEAHGLAEEPAPGHALLPRREAHR